MPLPIGTILNQIPAPPYKSTRVALLYEILQRLGGNPEEIMSREWTPGNEGQLRPPYTSLTDALLYEIWMVIDGAGGGGGTGTEIIYYGVVKDGAAITPAQGIGSKIIPQSANYYIVPPAIANLVGNETTHVRLWIAEPATEPVKTATLWLRNLGTTFINEAIAPGGLMSVQNIGSYRVYVSEPMDAQLFNGQFVGPVFCSQVRNVSVSWGGTPPPPQNIDVEVFNNTSGATISMVLKGSEVFPISAAGGAYPLGPLNSFLGSDVPFIDVLHFFINNENFDIARYLRVFVNDVLQYEQLVDIDGEYFTPQIEFDGPVRIELSYE